MNIIAVVCSESEYKQLNANSFNSARKIGFKTFVVIPASLKLIAVPYDSIIKLNSFSDFGEANISSALSTMTHMNYILHVDPDEFYSLRLLSDISAFARNMCPGEIGAIKMSYYYKNYRLRGTPWGGIKSFPRIASSTEFINRTYVHQRLNGVEVEVSTNEIVRHYWVDSIYDLRAKHKRYLEHEGLTKAALYGVWDFKGFAIRMLKVHIGILRRINLLDGFLGLLLALEFSKYAIRAELAFKKLSKNLN